MHHESENTKCPTRYRQNNGDDPLSLSTRILTGVGFNMYTHAHRICLRISRTMKLNDARQTVDFGFIAHLGLIHEPRSVMSNVQAKITDTTPTKVACLTFDVHQKSLISLHIHEPSALH